MESKEAKKNQALTPNGRRARRVSRPPPDADRRTGELPVLGLPYVERRADTELTEALGRGEYCYVLAPPRSGKSSLRRRTSQRLAEQGAACAQVDLSHLGQRVLPEAFYRALMAQIADGLKLPDPMDFWGRVAADTTVDRFLCYLRDEVLAWIGRPVVIFIDEIDAVRALGAEADGFLAALRALQAERGRDLSLRRLTFCLLGSAAPATFLRAPQALWDLARRVALPDLTAEEGLTLLPFVPGPPGPAGAAPEPGADDEAARALSKILSWTAGHPYLTMRLCEGLHEESGTFGAPEERVDQLVSQLFSISGDLYLRQLSQRFDQILPEGLRVQALSLYRRLLFGERVPRNPDERAQDELLLVGLLREEEDESGNRWVRVRNRVFEHAFSREWVAEKGQGRLLSGLVIRWLQSGRSAEHVLRGKDLDEVLTWAVPGKNTTLDEAEFLRAGLVLRQEEELRQLRDELHGERRAHAEERARRRRQRDVTAAAAVALLLSVGSGVSWLLTRTLEAEQKAAEATADARAQATRADEARAGAARARGLLEYAAGRLTDVAYPPDLPGEPAVERARRPAFPPGLLPETVDPLQRELDGLAALALSRQPEGRAAALLLGVQAVGQGSGQSIGQGVGQGSGQPVGQAGGQGVGAAPAGALRGVFGAVSEALAAGRALRGYPVLRGHGGQVRAAAFSPDGARVVTASDDQTARLWDARSGQSIALLGPARELLRGAVFSPDGERVLTYGNDRVASVYRARDGALLTTLRGHTAELRAAAFFPISGPISGSADRDRLRIVTASGDGTARVWDARTGDTLAVLRGHGQALLSCAVSPDGQQILTGSQDRTAMLWSVAAPARPLLTLRGHDGEIRSVAFSPPGSGEPLLLTASQDRTARVWSGTTGAPLSTLSGHEDALVSAAFSPAPAADGPRVLTASADRTARLWAPRTGLLLSVLRGHTGPLYGAAFSPDGTQALTGGADRAALLFDLRGAGPGPGPGFGPSAAPILSVLRGHAGPVFAVAFSPDGSALMTASGDRTARLFPASARAILRAGCDLLAGAPASDAIASVCGPTTALAVP